MCWDGNGKAEKKQSKSWAMRSVSYLLKVNWLSMTLKFEACPLISRSLM